MSQADPRQLSPAESAALLAPIVERLLTPDPVMGVEVDPEVFTHSGAVLLPEVRADSFVVPQGPAGVLVAGDVVVADTLRQEGRSAPLLVFGNLTVRRIVTDGYLVVMGDLVVEEVFHGSSSNYGTHVFGETRIHTLLLEKNHHFVPARDCTVEVRIEDEVDGFGAVQRHLVAPGRCR